MKEGQGEMREEGLMEGEEGGKEGWRGVKEGGRRSTTLRSLESSEARVPWVSSQPVRPHVAPGSWRPRDPPNPCGQDAPLTP